jgi:hypothetical protein
MRSRVAVEIRCGLLNANDTAERETPAAAATSVDVGLPDLLGLFAALIASPLKVLAVLAPAFFGGINSPGVGAHHNPADAGGAADVGPGGSEKAHEIATAG